METTENLSVSTVQEKITLSPDFLERTLTQPQFIDNIVGLAHHAQLNGAEGIFIVSKVNDVPLVSPVNRSPRVKDIQSAKLSHSAVIDPLIIEEFGAESGDLSKKDKIKEGVVMVIHSHPLKSLYFSEGDLESFEESVLELRNPYLIEGVMVRQGQQVSILFMQTDPERQQDIFYQQWNYLDGPNAQLRLLRESGFRVQIVRFDLKKKQFEPEELEKVGIFAVY